MRSLRLVMFMGQRRSRNMSTEVEHEAPVAETGTGNEAMDNTAELPDTVGLAKPGHPRQTRKSNQRSTFPPVGSRITRGSKVCQSSTTRCQKTTSQIFYSKHFCISLIALARLSDELCRHKQDVGVGVSQCRFGVNL